MWIEFPFLSVPALFLDVDQGPFSFSLPLFLLLPHSDHPSHFSSSLLLLITVRFSPPSPPFLTTPPFLTPLFFPTALLDRKGNTHYETRDKNPRDWDNGHRGRLGGILDGKENARYKPWDKSLGTGTIMTESSCIRYDLGTTSLTLTLLQIFIHCISIQKTIRVPRRWTNSTYTKKFLSNQLLYKGQCPILPIQHQDALSFISHISHTQAIRRQNFHPHLVWIGNYLAWVKFTHKPSQHTRLAKTTQQENKIKKSRNGNIAKRNTSPRDKKHPPSLRVALLRIIGREKYRNVVSTLISFPCSPPIPFHSQFSPPPNAYFPLLPTNHY